MTTKLIFTIPPDKVKIKGGHVSFALYANGALTGDLCMTQAEFKCFQATIVEEDRHSNNLRLGMKVGEHFAMRSKGWKILNVERLKFWKRSENGYVQNIEDAGDFSFEAATKIVTEANIANHSPNSKRMGAEELLVYVPSDNSPKSNN